MVGDINRPVSMAETSSSAVREPMMAGVASRRLYKLHRVSALSILQPQVSTPLQQGLHRRGVEVARCHVQGRAACVVETRRIGCQCAGLAQSLDGIA